MPHSSATAYRYSICFDFPNDLIYTPFTRDSLEKLFKLYQSWGGARIDWIYTWKHRERLWEGTLSASLSRNDETARRAGRLDALSGRIHWAAECLVQNRRLRIRRRQDDIPWMTDTPARCDRLTRAAAAPRSLPRHCRKYMVSITHRRRWQRMFRDYLRQSRKLGHGGFIVYESAFAVHGRPGGSFNVPYPDVPRIMGEVGAEYPGRPSGGG